MNYPTSSMDNVSLPTGLDKQFSRHVFVINAGLATDERSNYQNKPLTKVIFKQDPLHTAHVLIEY